MQAVSDDGVVQDRAFVMPPAGKPSLLHRMGILLGVSWDYHKSPPPAQLSLFQRRFAVAFGSLAILASAVAPATSLASGYDPTSDMNSMFNTTQYTGAQAWWSAGYTGAGVDVALIDTGVSPVEGLSSAGKIVYGPDLLVRVPERRIPQSRHQRPRHLHGRHHRRPWLRCRRG